MLKLTNNATALLAGSMDTNDTSVTLEAGSGAKFPSLSDGDWFPLVAVDDSGNFEIMKCTARGTDILTVTRAQEGTTAKSFAAGDRVDLRLTAAAITEIQSMTSAQVTEALGFTPAKNDLSNLSDEEDARDNLGVGDNFDGLPTSIDVGTDLDTIISQQGFYRFHNDNNNSPPWVTSHGFLLVQRYGGSGYVSQLAISMNGTAGRIGLRALNNNVWTDWMEITTEGTVATAAQILAGTVTNAIPVDQAWEAGEWHDLGNVSGALTLDCSEHTRFYGTMTANTSVALSDLKNGQCVSLVLYQDATGNRVITWDDAIKFPQGVDPVIDAGAGQVAVVAMFEGSWSPSALIFGSGWRLR